MQFGVWQYRSSAPVSVGEVIYLRRVNKRMLIEPGYCWHGRPSPHVISHARQRSLAVPSRVSAMSTDLRKLGR